MLHRPRRPIASVSFIWSYFNPSPHPACHRAMGRTVYRGEDRKTENSAVCVLRDRSTTRFRGPQNSRSRSLPVSPKNFQRSDDNGGPFTCSHRISEALRQAAIAIHFLPGHERCPPAKPETARYPRFLRAPNGRAEIFTTRSALMAGVMLARNRSVSMVPGLTTLTRIYPSPIRSPSVVSRKSTPFCSAVRIRDF